VVWFLGNTAPASEDGEMIFNLEEDGGNSSDGAFLPDGTPLCGKGRNSLHKTCCQSGTGWNNNPSESGSSNVSIGKSYGAPKVQVLSSSPDSSSVNPSASASLLNLVPNVSSNPKNLEWNCVALPHFSAATQQALALASLRAKTGQGGNICGHSHHQVFFRRRAQSFCSKMIPYMAVCESVRGVRVEIHQYI